MIIRSPHDSQARHHHGPIAPSGGGSNVEDKFYVLWDVTILGNLNFFNCIPYENKQQSLYLISLSRCNEENKTSSPPVASAVYDHVSVRIKMK